MNSRADKNTIKSISGILKVHEIIKDKFYFAIATNTGLATCLDYNNDQIIFYCANNNLLYQPLIFDFGPYSLADIWKYCMCVKKYLRVAKQQNKVLVHITSEDKEKLVNSAFVCGCYSILYLDYEPEQIYDILSDHNKTKFIGFRDACIAPSQYSLALLECFKAVKKASKFKFLDFKTFNVQEYVHYEQVVHGDLNWIIPNKILAFSGPHNKTEKVNDHPQFAPDFYFNFFRKNNVTTIIRLNERRYDERKFTDHGFEHKDLIFRDGTSPNQEILKEFLKTCENAKGAVAVHCKAGLGRTGTLIVCYLIKHYRFSAHEAIAWTRICRPGSVIANQQIFLIKNEPYLLFKGEIYDLEHNTDESGVSSLNKLLQCESKNIQTEDELGKMCKKLACKLKKVNLEIRADDEQRDDTIENNKDTQGDILNKLKWTRSKSRLMSQGKLTEQIDQTQLKNGKNSDSMNCDDKQAKELFRLTEHSNSSSISIKKLIQPRIQHYNSKCENERDNFQKKKIGTDKSSIHYRTRSFTSSLLNRSKIGSNSITKPNLIINNTTLMTDKLIKATAPNLKINSNKKVIIQNEKNLTKQSPRSRLSRGDSK